jgi:IclR family pca regulon transcriptional regulator
MSATAKNAKAPSATESEHGRARHFVQSLDRGLAVIKAFDAEDTALSPSDVAARTGLTRTAARRFLLTLVDLGYVKSDGRLFELTPKVLELGYAYMSSLRLPDLALSSVEQLVADVGEDSEMGILDGHDVVYVLRIPGPRFLSMSINVGSRLPAHVTSLGRVLLAALPDEQLDEYLRTARLESFSPQTITEVGVLRKEIERAREAGWALIDQELEEGLRAIAVPIRGRDGQVLAAVNLSTNAARQTIPEVERGLLPKLLQAAARIEQALRESGVREGI